MSVRFRTPREITLDEALTIALDALFKSPRADALEAYAVLRSLRRNGRDHVHHAAEIAGRDCPMCPARLPKGTPRLRYCSARCRQRAYTARHLQDAQERIAA